MSSFEYLSAMQTDVLKELANIGAGNATTALAKMVGKRIEIGVPDIQLVKLADLQDFIGEAEKVMTGILIELSGELNGVMMFLIDERISDQMINILLHRDKGTEVTYNEMEKSVIMEVGNIIISAYIKSISKMTRLSISPSVPMFQIDMASALLSVPATQFCIVSDKVLMIQTQFSLEKTSDMVKGYYIFAPDVESFDKIFHSLGIK